MKRTIATTAQNRSTTTKRPSGRPPPSPETIPAWSRFDPLPSRPEPGNNGKMGSKGTGEDGAGAHGTSAVTEEEWPSGAVKGFSGRSS